MPPRRRPTREQQRSEARAAAELAELIKWYVAQTAHEDPEDGDQTYAAIEAWGDDEQEISRVAQDVAADLGLEMRLQVKLVRAIAGAGRGPLARCQPLEQLIEIDIAKWIASRPWRRLEHLAHEVFHAYQYEGQQRYADAAPREDDLPHDQIAAWNRSPRDYWNPDLAGAFTIDSSAHKLGFLRMLRRYSSHPYEADAANFARWYLHRRAGLPPPQPPAQKR